MEVAEIKEACDWCLRDEVLQNVEGKFWRFWKTISSEDPPVTSLNRICSTCATRYREFSDYIERCKSNETVIDMISGGIEEPSSRRHACEICNKVYAKASHLKRHLSSHSGEKRFECERCKRRFAQSGSLKAHMKLHTGEKPFECGVCNKRFFTKGHLNTHSVTHTGEKRFECGDCGKKFSQSSYLKIHSRIHTGDRPYVCAECDKSFAYAQALRSHARSHTGEKPFTCDKCDKTFTQACNLKAHLRLHDAKRPFGCDKCDKTFAQRSHLKTHLVAHTARKSFSCTLCDTKFDMLGEFRAHLQVHVIDMGLGTDDRRFSCPKCTKNFTTFANLRQHFHVHSGDRPFKCTRCDKSFIKINFLETHMRVHDGVKPFECRECKKRFSYANSLKTHRRTHTGDRPFKCSECDKSFAQSGALTRHLIHHTGEKSHACSLCDKTFVTSGDLNTHSKVHSDDRPFECERCDRSFRQARSLRTHSLTHENQASCSLKMDPPGMDNVGVGGGVEFPKNPLLCPICHDYFAEPCILGCYHTFCARCLKGREQDRKLICPFCRQPTFLKDGTSLPPPDSLMRQLIDIANSENPPCSNCDKRDRANMYYCNTCGQALCSSCRDNTHRAKMFSSHEVVHMTKCMKEPKKCLQHGEHYIMFSPMQNAMLCVNCFRDLSNEFRAQCVDIDTAHAQAAKRLERGQNAIMDLQTSVRDGIIALKGLMDELRRNMDSEKHTINTFCQGMQEAMAKTHATMIMEVQRQFESKERIYRSQLLVLGTVMPVLQLHLVLCTTFTTAANKYQFLELCPSLIDRLAAVGNLSQPVRSLQGSQIKTNYRSEFAQSLEPWIGQAAVSQHQSELAAVSRMYDSAPPATKRQQTALKNKMSDGEGSFSSHCRSFESQIRELNQQFNVVKEKVGELHKDISALRKAQTPPLIARYETLTRECLHLDQSLERQQQELDRMSSAFDASWEEQLWRIRVEQEVFSCQRADINTLRNELKHLSQVATQLEPYIRSLTPAQQSQGESDQAHLANLLEHIGLMQQSESSLGKIPRSRSRVLGQLLEKVRPNLQERERSKSAGQTDKPVSMGTPQKNVKKPFMTSNQQISIDRLEAQIKEKLHDMINRRQNSSKSDTETKTTESKPIKLDQRITYKKINKSCDKIDSTGETRRGKSESDYQRISEATSRSSPCSPKKKIKVPTKQQQQQKKKIYPYSDGEDNVFYSMHDSADSLSTESRRSSFDGDAPDKTLVVVINRRNNGKGMSLAQKQRSWETFPPKRRHHHHVCHQQQQAQHKLSVPTPLRKADSFEGHEEAVKSIVAAVQETRRKPKGGNN